MLENICHTIFSVHSSREKKPLEKRDFWPHIQVCGKNVYENEAAFI